MIDWSLPVVTLDECSDPAALEAKFWAEWEEYVAEPVGTMASLMELWDCLQVTASWEALGGDRHRPLQRIVRYIMEMYYHRGLPVAQARERMLVKNATRPRPGGGTGYYSPDVCAEIMAGTWGEK